MIENLVNLFSENPAYLGIAVVLAAVILFGVIKKLVKLALVVAAVLVIYVAYLAWSGEDVSDSLKDLGEKSTEIIESGKEKVGDYLEEKSEQAVDDILDK
jgi:hypothetical protein